MTRAQLTKHLADPNVSAYARALDPDAPLDRWISFAVKVLRDAGIETYESCQGGAGHSYPEPAVRFFGTSSDGLRAVAAAVTYGLPVYALRRFWSMTYGELTGPQWEIVFQPLATLKRRQRDAEREGMLEAPAARSLEPTAP